MSGQYKQPRFVVKVNQADITETIKPRLISMTLTDDTGFESDTLELQLADHDDAHPLQLPPTGAEAEVFIGYGDDLHEMGKYIIDEVTMHGPPCVMTLRGRAAIFDKTPAGQVPFNSQKTRSWPKGTKFGALAAKIAKEHGMTLAMAKELQSIPLAHLDQKAESDLNLLLRLGKLYDCITKPAGGVLAIVRRGKLLSAKGEKLAKITLEGKELTSFSLQVATRDGAGTVAAFYHTTRGAKNKPVIVGKGNPVKKLRHWYKSEAQALAGANSEYDKRLRNMRKVSFAFPGRPEVTAESPIVVKNLRPAFEGEWVVTQATHSFSSAGYTTSVEATTLVALQMAALAAAGDDAQPVVDKPDTEEPDDDVGGDEPADEDPASGDVSTDPEPRTGDETGSGESEGGSGDDAEVVRDT